MIKYQRKIENLLSNTIQFNRNDMTNKKLGQINSTLYKISLIQLNNLFKLSKII